MLFYHPEKHITNPSISPEDKNLSRKIETKYEGLKWAVAFEEVVIWDWETDTNEKLSKIIQWAANRWWVIIEKDSVGHRFIFINRKDLWMTDEKLNYVNLEGLLDDILANKKTITKSLLVSDFQGSLQIGTLEKALPPTAQIVVNEIKGLVDPIVVPSPEQLYIPSSTAPEIHQRQ